MGVLLTHAQPAGNRLIINKFILYITCPIFGCSHDNGIFENGLLWSNNEAWQNSFWDLNYAEEWIKNESPLLLNIKV